eukprot:18114-Pyramimonas_sp.AAC.2
MSSYHRKYLSRMCGKMGCGWARGQTGFVSRIELAESRLLSTNHDDVNMEFTTFHTLLDPGVCFRFCSISTSSV